MAFTHVPVSNKFTPRSGQRYYFIGANSPKNGLSLLVGKRTWTGDKFDRARASMNNVFPTIEAAKAARQTISATLKTIQLS